MQELLLAVLLIAVGVVAFVFCIRIGILLGQRLDRAVEARAAADEPGPSEEITADE
jgi:hypothetical protein